ncbi:hypothetical protein CYMTET_22430 [Cymbomonas tetramitiformis]|uniref:Acyltransferase 3 domain-containing protein n=1 Tax=Cymbomonas tetramitiformis TaxID=36881 RepID=A0AAE0FZX3_9CHLO|nr:hypothetical protein CYMTET_22430 [Cymbomonas tetramitiformis]|eukprot:gene18450-22015_t
MEKLDQKKATYVFGAILSVSVIIVAAGGIIGLILLCVLASVTVLTLILHFRFGPFPFCKCIGAQDEEQPTSVPPAPPLSSQQPRISTLHDVDPAPLRLYYLDNLKTFLTAIVVVHHITCSYAGLGWIYGIGAFPSWFKVFGQTSMLWNQIYFMCLFFFISAYFTPTSCDRKGAHAFLKDKYDRLGIPFLVYTFVFGPLLNVFIKEVALNQTYSFFPDAGPTWFLLWLLIFNTVYTFVGGDIVTAPFPTLTSVFTWGFGLGFIQAVCMAVLPMGFIFMPITFGSLPFDILFFTAGVVAKRSRWLEDDLPRLIKEGVARGWVALSAGFGLIIFHIGFIFKLAEVDTVMLQVTEDSDSDDFIVLILTIVVYNLYCGILTILFSLSAVAIFHTYFNYSTPTTKWFASAAYTVYLIHGWVLTLLTAAYVGVLRAAGEVIEFEDDKSYSKSHMSSEGWLWLGWLLTVVLTMGICWPLASVIRQLPGCRDIL